MKKVYCIATIVVCIALFQGIAHAGGHGAYFSWGRGWPSVGFPDFLEEKYPGVQADLSLQLDHFTVGYIYDSAPTRAEYLTYRGTIGFDIACTKLTDQEIKYGSFTLPEALEGVMSDLFDATGYGFSTKHTLAYTLLNSERFKCWLGPSVRLNVNYQNPSAITGNIGTIEYSLNPWAVNLSVGGGFEGGVNCHLNCDMSLSLSTGFHYNAFGYYLKAEADTSISSLGLSQDWGGWGGEPYVFVEISLLFRSGEDLFALRSTRPTAPETPSPILTPVPTE